MPVAFGQTRVKLTIRVNSWGTDTKQPDDIYIHKMCTGVLVFGSEDRVVVFTNGYQNTMCSHHLYMPHVRSRNMTTMNRTKE